MSLSLKIRLTACFLILSIVFVSVISTYENATTPKNVTEEYGNSLLDYTPVGVMLFFAHLIGTTVFSFISFFSKVFGS